MSYVFRSGSLLALGLILVLSGCRTYGGHGSEEALYNQIVEGNRVFADELQRAQTDANLLTTAAASDARLAPFQARYEGMLVAHEAMLYEHQQMEADLSESSSHRDLSRAFGAIMADHRLMRNQYLRSLQAISQVDTERPPYSARMFNLGFYSVSPVFYERAQSDVDRQINMRRALAAAAEEAELEVDEELLEGGEEENVMGTGDQPEEG